jgi:hypothetical protein
MQSKDFHPFSEALQTLVSICQSKGSGVMYFVSPENQIAAVSLKRGEITGIRYRNTFNQQAIEGLKKFSQARFNFASRDTLAAPEIKGLSTEEILVALGAASLGHPETDHEADDFPFDPSPQISPATQRALQDLATLYLGPIAVMMSQRVFQQTGDLPTAIQMLAQLIPDPGEAQAFMKEAQKLS